MSDNPFPPIEPVHAADQEIRLAGTVSRIGHLRRRRVALSAMAAGALVLAVVLPITLTGGSGRSGSVQVVGGPSTTASAPTSAVTSLPPTTSPTAQASCDETAITAGVGRYTRYTAVTGYGCAGNFAYAFVTVPAPISIGGVGETLLLKTTVDSWQVVNRSTYCNDGLVPAAIRHNACETN